MKRFSSYNVLFFNGGNEHVKSLKSNCFTWPTDSNTHSHVTKCLLFIVTYSAMNENLFWSTHQWLTTYMSDIHTGRSRNLELYRPSTFRCLSLTALYMLQNNRRYLRVVIRRRRRKCQFSSQPQFTVTRPIHQQTINNKLIQSQYANIISNGM